MQGLTQAHLLKDNDRLNLAITTLQGEKSMLLEEKAKSDKELAGLRADNERLRDLLRKMRVAEADGTPAAADSPRARSRRPWARGRRTTARGDAKRLRALREGGESLAAKAEAACAVRINAGGRAVDRGAVLKKVEERLTGARPRRAGPRAAGEVLETGGGAAQAGEPAIFRLSLFGRGQKRRRRLGERLSADYVVQGGFFVRVANSFTGSEPVEKNPRGDAPASTGRAHPRGKEHRGDVWDGESHASKSGKRHEGGPPAFSWAAAGTARDRLAPVTCVMRADGRRQFRNAAPPGGAVGAGQAEAFSLHFLRGGLQQLRRTTADDIAERRQRSFWVFLGLMALVWLVFYVLPSA